MRAIRQLLAEQGPMPLWDFYARACAVVPAEATLYGKHTRLSLVKRWMRLHKDCISITDDAICLTTQSKVSAVATLLHLLKTNGTVLFEQTGMTNRQTFFAYICAMRKLNWIGDGVHGRITWQGPADASAEVVNRFRRMKQAK